jgi:uncharacterized membrane protein YcaP (DUF421 family)
MFTFWPNHDLWSSMFDLDSPSVVEKMLRPIVIYIFLVVGLRLAGKRELAQMNPLDLIVLLTLSNTVQNAIIGNDNTVSGGIIGAVTLLAANYLLNVVTFRSSVADRIVNGEPVPLIANGELQKGNLDRQTISVEELSAMARKQGFRDLGGVQEAMLETSGTISLLARTPTDTDLAFGRLQAQLDRIEAMLKAAPR